MAVTTAGWCLAANATLVALTPKMHNVVCKREPPGSTVHGGQGAISHIEDRTRPGVRVRSLRGELLSVLAKHPQIDEARTLKVGPRRKTLPPPSQSTSSSCRRPGRCPQGRAYRRLGR